MAKGKLPNKGDTNVTSAQIQAKATVVSRSSAPQTKAHDDAKIRKILGEK